MKKLILLLSLTVLWGCTSIEITSYTPKLLIDGTGDLNVTRFLYEPYEEGLLKQNQIDTGAGLNPIYTVDAVDDYVKNALMKELKFIGYHLQNTASLEISGVIQEFSCDYVGFGPIHSNVKIEFAINEIRDGSSVEIYRKNHSGYFQANKWSTLEYNAYIQEALSQCIESFILDTQNELIL